MSNGSRLNTRSTLAGPLLAFAFLLLCAAVGRSQDLAQLEQESIAAAVARVSPSVVRIETVGGLERIDKVLLGTGATTGVVVDPQGYIISSAFHFARKPSAILVRIGDQQKSARLVATDHHRHLVLLKVDVDKPLPVLETVSEKAIRVGQWAIAVGRGMDSQRPNLAVGIISAKGRVWGRALQTDAAVSPANYGGPLVDIQGRLLGILLPLSPQGDSEVAGIEWYDSGIGFAVPAEHIQAVLPRLMKGEDLHRGLLGIGFRSRNLQLDPPVLGTVHPGSPADQAGWKPGDRIVQIGERKIERAAEVRAELSRLYAGSKVRIILSRDKQRIDGTLELVQRLPVYQRPWLGILPARPGKSKDEGVTVRGVEAESPAAKAGLQPGDRIAQVEGKDVAGREELANAIADQRPAGTVRLSVRRGDKKLDITVKLASWPEALPKTLPAHRRAAKSAEAKDQGRRGRVTIQVHELAHQILAWVPEDRVEGEPLGLLVWLPGFAEVELAKVVEAFRPAAEAGRFIVAAVRPNDGKPWQTSDAMVVPKIVQTIGQQYSLDRLRIAVGGELAAGTIALSAALQSREAIRGAVTVDGPALELPGDPSPGQPLTFLVAYSSGSRLASTFTQQVEELRAKRYPVAVIPLGPEGRSLTASELDELARWMDVLDRI